MILLENKLSKHARTLICDVFQRKKTQPKIYATKDSKYKNNNLNPSRSIFLQVKTLTGDMKLKETKPEKRTQQNFILSALNIYSSPSRQKLNTSENTEKVTLLYMPV